MKAAFLILFLSSISAVLSSADLKAEHLVIRQYTGGFIRVESDEGLDLLILPSESAKPPAGLSSSRTFFL
ncbi:MAG: hypothetical protein AAF664_24970, partial [Planctomycetota bacterium]